MSSMSSGVRRVVVTGLGVVSPLGNEVSLLWKRVLAGECGIKRLVDPSFSNLTVNIAATVSFDTSKWISKMQEKRVPTADVIFAYAAASKALEDAKLASLPVEERESFGVALGVSSMPLGEIISEYQTFMEKGPRRLSPFFVPKVLINTSCALVSMEFGLQGPNLATSTACSASSHAIGEAFRLIRNGDTDVMVAGGTEPVLEPLMVGAFARINALATKFNDNPLESSRPFDKDRSGFVMAEGAAVLILEEYEYAKQRGAKIYAEVLGYGLSGDAFHLTSPSEDGRGAIRSMKAALRDANLQPKDVCYINAHATSTPVGDAIENRAIKDLFGDHAIKLQVSSTKGSTGHLLGTAGAIEAILTCLAINERVAPPTLNLHEVSSKSEFNLNYVPRVPQQLSGPNGAGKIVALSNSFGFGGTNASLCFGEVL